MIASRQTKQQTLMNLRSGTLCILQGQCFVIYFHKMEKTFADII